MNDSYRWAHAVETAHTWGQLGAVLGGPFGGPASMGMGLLGLIYGRITADAKIAEEETRVQTQVQKEVTKDQQLEAAIEKELERQRAFETQVAGATETAGKNRPVTELSQLPASVSPPAANSGGIAIASVAKPAQPQPPPAPFKNVEVKDLNNDGIADLWIYYNPQKPGEILRQEESSRGNSSVDTWSYFKDGKLVRRDVDSKGFGRPDTIFYYDDQKIVREERDENGQGRMTYRADYQDGRLAKVERDSLGSGRPDSWIVYDTSKDGEVVLKEERDLDGDGLPDTWSYYEQGRLVRRDVSRVGREILSKQEGLPLSSGAIRQPSLPGS
ncbi:MAG: hypothetical protein OEN50_00485 [Deltaproteobacteria bacterium]|nr:hypothetical protein [Deltaproteobacteria bacterium]